MYYDMDTGWNDIDDLEPGDVVLNASVKNTAIQIKEVYRGVGIEAEGKCVHLVKVLITRHDEIKAGDICLWSEYGLAKLFELD